MTLVPAQMCLNTGDQFLQAEWLGNIVVPSGPQAVDLILFCDPRRQEQDRADDMIPNDLAQFQY